MIKQKSIRVVTDYWTRLQLMNKKAAFTKDAWRKEAKKKPSTTKKVFCRVFQTQLLQLQLTTHGLWLRNRNGRDMGSSWAVAEPEIDTLLKIRAKPEPKTQKARDRLCKQVDLYTSCTSLVFFLVSHGTNSFESVLAFRVLGKTLRNFTLNPIACFHSFSFFFFFFFTLNK